jgi:hypothetical protein
MYKYLYLYMAKLEKPGALPDTAASRDKIVAILNVLFIILGSICLLMVTVGGFKYVISQGEAREVKSAKDTIIYAVIGLVISLSAYAIVNFVIKWFIG